MRTSTARNTEQSTPVIIVASTPRTLARESAGI
jgi:hypothetical protein